VLRLKSPIRTESSFRCQVSLPTVLEESRRSEESVRFAFAYRTMKEPRCLSTLCFHKESLFGLPSYNSPQKIEDKQLRCAYVFQGLTSPERVMTSE